MGAVDRGAEGGDGGRGRPEPRAVRASRARAGTLYVVATPLGNLRDVTLRALDVLRSVDVVAAEDTRVTATLLAHHGIATRLLSLHSPQRGGARGRRSSRRSAAAQSVALVSDAGTPGDQRPRRAARARGPRRGLSGRAGAGAVGGGRRGVAPPGSTPSVRVRRAFCRRRPRRAARCSRRSRRCRWRSSCTRRRIACARPSPSWRSRWARRATLVVARELTKTFETIARVPLARRAGVVRRGRQPRARRVRADRRRAAERGARGRAIAGRRAGVARRAAHELPPARAARVVAERTGAPRDALYARALARTKDADA